MIFRNRFAQARQTMVSEHLRKRGIRDERVLQAMQAIPRERFVSEELQQHAYDDRPLGIGEAQTISQPFMVALMTQCAQIQPTDKVLEIGTGSGYHTAVLSWLADEVWSVERHQSLHLEATKRLRKLRATNVGLVLGNGVEGLPDHAPFDAIVVAAATPKAPPALLQQLAPGGRLVIPLGPADSQQLTVIQRTDGQWISRDAGACRFVPLVDA